MIILISVVTIILYIIFFAFTFHNLKPITEMTKKILFFGISIVAMIIVTFIVFNISASGIQYENPEMMRIVRTMMLVVFVPVNGMVIIPYIANVVSKIYTNNITQAKIKKKVIIISIIFVIVLVFECSYLKTTQQGIINLISNR